MELKLATFLLVCPLVFLAGFVDAIGGGGGLISLPAYLLAGVPVHFALATNKMSSASGTLISTVRICRSIKIRWKLAIPAVACALAGSYIGTRLSLLTDEKILRYVLIVVLPVVAFFVLRKNSLVSEKTKRLDEKKEMAVSWVSAFLIGIYDGFYGPGTGAGGDRDQCGHLKLPLHYLQTERDHQDPYGKSGFSGNGTDPARRLEAVYLSHRQEKFSEGRDLRSHHLFGGSGGKCL